MNSKGCLSIGQGAKRASHSALGLAGENGFDPSCFWRDIEAMQTRAEILASRSFSLSLSSGFFGYFAHIGFVQAFEDRGLKASTLSGSSAGALVAAGLASGRSAAELKEIFLNIRKSDFWDPSLGFGYLKGEKVEELLQRYCVNKFSDALVPLHISVFNLKKRATEVITEGAIAKACRASAAVPLLFHPVRLRKDLLLDGGIRDRAGHAGVRGSEHESVIHYLQSENLVSKIEDLVLYRDLHKQPFFFKTANPFKSGPSSLENGHEVINYFYKKTTQWLDKKI